MFKYLNRSEFEPLSFNDFFSLLVHPSMMMPFAVFVWTVNAPTQMSFYFVISAILLYIKSVMEYLTFQKVKEQKYFQINKYCFIMVGWLLRFEFQLPHPTLSPALATDEKWPLNQFHISYQTSKISWPKAPVRAELSFSQFSFAESSCDSLA